MRLLRAWLWVCATPKARKAAAGPLSSRHCDVVSSVRCCISLGCKKQASLRATLIPGAPEWKRTAQFEPPGVSQATATASSHLSRSMAARMASPTGVVNAFTLLGKKPQKPQQSVQAMPRAQLAGGRSPSDVLQHFWGYSSFRSPQDEVIQARGGSQLKCRHGAGVASTRLHTDASGRLYHRLLCPCSCSAVCAGRP